MCLQGEDEAGTRGLRKGQVADSGKRRTKGQGQTLAEQMEEEVRTIVRDCMVGVSQWVIQPPVFPFTAYLSTSHDMGSWRCLPAHFQVTAVDLTMLTDITSSFSI